MSSTVVDDLNIAASWIPRMTGTISMVGSMAIICSLWHRENRLDLPNFRFLFAMSIVDIFNSLSLTVSSAAIPRGDFYGAIGNNATCAVQGFFNQFGTAVPYYNASLCLYAFLTIRKNYTAEKFATTIEPYCHSIALLLPLMSAMLVLSLDLFHGGNEMGGGPWCWIYVNDLHGLDDKSSIRNMTILILMFAAIPVGMSSLMVYYTMWSVYQYVSNQNSQLRRQNMLGRAHVPMIVNQQKMQTARQALLYSLAFIVTFFFITLYQILILVGMKEREHLLCFSVLRALQSIFLPLQGFWNFVIHFPPLITCTKRRNPTVSTLRAFQMALFGNNDRYRRQRRFSTTSAANDSFPLPVIQERLNDIPSRLDRHLPAVLVNCVTGEDFSVSALTDPTMVDKHTFQSTLSFPEDSTDSHEMVNMLKTSYTRNKNGSTRD